MRIAPDLDTGFKRKRRVEKARFVRLGIERYLLPRLGVDRLGDFKRPHQFGNHSPLVSFGKMDPRAHSPASTVAVMM